MSLFIYLRSSPCCMKVRLGCFELAEPAWMPSSQRTYKILHDRIRVGDPSAVANNHLAYRCSLSRSFRNQTRAASLRINSSIPVLASSDSLSCFILTSYIFQPFLLSSHPRPIHGSFGRITHNHLSDRRRPSNPAISLR